MKKSIWICLIGVATLNACQSTTPGTQVLDKGPEVDAASKYFDAWVAGDWAALRSLYADTAKSFHNSSMFSADSVIGFHKARRVNYEKVTYQSHAVEYLKYEDGKRWLHAWGEITLTIKGTGKEVGVPIHAARELAGDKIGTEYLYYNTLPIAQAIAEAAALATPSK